MRKILLSLALVLLSGAAVAQSTIDLTFNRDNSQAETNPVVTVTGTGDITDVTGVTSTISCNLNWKVFGANSETFPNASILCPDKNTKDMTPENAGVITFTLAGFSSAYEITKVTFRSVALNGSGAFQGDNANAQHIDFILLDQNDSEIARTENVEIKVNSNGGDNVEVSLNPNSPIKVTTDGINTLKLKLVNNYDARGCFYGLYNISLTVEPAEPAEPELPTNTLPTFQLKKSPLSASDLMSKTESCYIAIKNISQLNDAWYAGEVVGDTKRHSKYEFDQSTIFIWEPVVAGQPGSYRLRQLDGDYMQGDSPANFGTIDNAATFVVVNPGVGKTGNEEFNGDSGSIAFLLNGTKDPFLVRFVCGDKWINVARFQNSPNEADYLTKYNTGTGGFTINYAYEVIPKDGFEVNISDAKYSTMYTSYNVTLSKGLSAYIVDGLKEGDDTRVNLVEINSEIVPAFTPVILYAEIPGKYKLLYSDQGVDLNTEGNLLIGSLVDELAYELYYDGGVKARNIEGYVLSNPSTGVGLYKAGLNKANNTAFLNNGGKAYLPASALPISASVQGFKFGDFTSTAIEGVVTGNTGVKVIYDLSGRRFNNITNAGVYIINGKKVMVK